MNLLSSSMSSLIYDVPKIGFFFWMLRCGILGPNSEIDRGWDGLAHGMCDFAARGAVVHLNVSRVRGALALGIGLRLFSWVSEMKRI